MSESHLHKCVIIFNVPHIHAAEARVHTDARMCCREKDTQQLWTHRHPGEGRAPDEADTVKSWKEPELTRRVQINKRVGTELDESWKSLHAGQNLVCFCCFHPLLQQRSKL